MTADTRRIAILAEGALDFHHGKTAMSLLRYMPDDVVVVIDQNHAGQDTLSVLGFGRATPIVPDVATALAFGPTQLVIGIAPRGGDLPPEWRPALEAALGAGLTIVSGLHTMLNDDASLVALARETGARIIDVRRPSGEQMVATMQPRRAGATVVTFVGSDCAVGKMTAALEMTAAARALSLNARFVATGQTGIMLTGEGVPLDREFGDFMAGAIEGLVARAAQHADWVFVEGQGSLLHPGYSGVTLALLHGSQPDALVLVHPPGQTTIDEYSIRIPSLSRLVEIYEEAASWIKPAPVAAIALNTRTLSEQEARRAIESAEEETGLTADDPVRFGGTRLVTAVARAVGEPVAESAAAEKGRTYER